MALTIFRPGAEVARPTQQPAAPSPSRLGAVTFFRPGVTVPLPRSTRGLVCLCTSKRMEMPGGGSAPYDPLVLGHLTRCPLWLAQCPRCGATAGTHYADCPAWRGSEHLRPWWLAPTPASWTPLRSLDPLDRPPF